MSTFYFVDAAAAQAPLRALLDLLKAEVPSPIQWTIEPNGDVLEDTTGTLTASWVGTAQAPVACTGSGNYAAPAGFMVKWNTSTVSSGNRIAGRTFFVPCSDRIEGSDGLLNTTESIPRAADCQAFVTAQAGNMLVWGRPRAATPSWTDVRGRVHAAKAARAGVSAVVIGATIPDKPVVLTSRRD